MQTACRDKLKNKMITQGDKLKGTFIGTETGIYIFIRITICFIYLYCR